MNLVLDIHTHTLASGHAYSTVLELAAEAEKTGLALIAITDHAPAMPNATGEFYFLNLRVIPHHLHGVKIMMGVELNILDKSGRVDLDEQVYKSLCPVIASFHYPCYKFSREDMSDDEITEEITTAIKNVMDNPFIHIIGHPGDRRYPFYTEEIVKKSLETGTLLEINEANLIVDDSKFSRPDTRDTMLRILEICKAMHCPIVLGSDSHFANHTGKLHRSLELLEEADFPSELVANTSVEYFLSLLERKEK